MEILFSNHELYHHPLGLVSVRLLANPNVSGIPASEALVGKIVGIRKDEGAKTLFEMVLAEVQASFVDNSRVSKPLAVWRMSPTAVVVVGSRAEGDLEQVLPNLGAGDKIVAARDMLEVLPHIECIHQDIKPQNILWRDGHAHLCDFGHCRTVFSETHVHPDTCTLYTRAPAIMTRVKYGTEVDFWSLGVTLMWLEHAGPVPMSMELLNQQFSKLAQHAPTSFGSLFETQGAAGGPAHLQSRGGRFTTIFTSLLCCFEPGAAAASLSSSAFRSDAIFAKRKRPGVQGGPAPGRGSPVPAQIPLDYLKALDDSATTSLVFRNGDCPTAFTTYLSTPRAKQLENVYDALVDCFDDDVRHGRGIRLCDFLFVVDYMDRVGSYHSKVTPTLLFGSAIFLLGVVSGKRKNLEEAFRNAEDMFNTKINADVDTWTWLALVSCGFDVCSKSASSWAAGLGAGLDAKGWSAVIDNLAWWPDGKTTRQAFVSSGAKPGYATLSGDRKAALLATV